jgi:hypothetical protein
VGRCCLLVVREDRGKPKLGFHLIVRPAKRSGLMTAAKVTERIADPCIVACLLSLVLTVRNKLAAVGYSHVRAYRLISC